MLSFGFIVFIFASSSRIVFSRSMFYVNANCKMSLRMFSITFSFVIWYVWLGQIRMFCSIFWFSYNVCMYGWNASSTIADLSAFITSRAMLIRDVCTRLLRLNFVRLRIASKSLLPSFLCEPLNIWVILMILLRISGKVS